jgi:8-oxo-dGTP diphosphatase
MGNINLTVDAVVFAYEASQLYILLIKRENDPFKNKWALPGGFVEVDETVENAAKRELEEETGLSVDGLEQVHTFSAIHRDPRKRTISVAHYVLTKKTDKTISAGDDAADAGWFPMQDLPELAFDHDEIVRMAIERLGQKLKNKLVGLAGFSGTELEEIRNILKETR